MSENTGIVERLTESDRSPKSAERKKRLGRVKILCGCYGIRSEERPIITLFSPGAHPVSRRIIFAVSSATSPVKASAKPGVSRWILLFTVWVSARQQVHPCWRAKKTRSSRALLHSRSPLHIHNPHYQCQQGAWTGSGTSGNSCMYEQLFFLTSYGINRASATRGMACLMVNIPMHFASA